MHTTDNKKKKSKRGWWILGACAAIIVLLISFNRTTQNLFHIAYYYTFEFDHFNENDKVFASENFIKNKDFNSIRLYRLMRPLTLAELNTIDEYASNLNIKKDQTTLAGETILISCSKYFEKNKMNIRHSAYIGLYLKCDILNVFALNTKIPIKAMFYAIQPNKAILTEDYIYKSSLPVNYTWADSTFYVVPFEISNKELLKK